MQPKTKEEHIAKCEEWIEIYEEAEKAILTGKSYSIGGSSLTRENLVDVRNGRHEWEAKRQAILNDGQRSITPISFMDD